MRPASRLIALLAPVALLVLTGCPNDVEPVALNPIGPWTAADYDLQVASSVESARTGDPVTFTAVLLDPNGNDVTAEYDIRTEVSPPLGVLADGGGVYRFTNIDTYTYFASVEVHSTTLVGSASVEIEAGPPALISVSAEPPLVEAGEAVTMTAHITDAYGNPTTGEVSWSVDPTATLTGNEVVATEIGHYEVTGHLDGTEASDTDGFSVEAAEPSSLSISVSSYSVERGQGVIVTSTVLDQFGNPSDHEVTLSTDGVGTEVWADFVRFHEEGIFTVYGDIPEYGLHDSDGPVLVDSTGPQIRVTTPARGAEIPSAANPTVIVSGSVTDPWTGVTSVTINGAPATLLAGGLFTYTMTPELGLNEIVVEAADGDGNVSDHFQTYLWGEFLPPGEPNEDGILARLNEGAIDLLESFIEDAVESGSLTDGILGNVYTSPTYCLDLWVVEICGTFLIDVAAVGIGNLEMDLDPHNPTGGFPNGYLGFAMDLDGIAVTLEPQGVFSACVVVLGCYSETVGFDAIVGADEITLDTDVGLSVNAANEIEVSLANTDVGVDGLYLDLSDIGLIGDILGSISTFLLNLFEPVFELLLPPIMEAALPGAIESALADLEIVQEIDLLGAVLEIGALPQDINIDDDGMTIAMESIAVAEPAPTAPPTLGSWRRSDYIVPDYGPGPDFAVSLADNFVNQLMHAVWQGGVMDFSMSSEELGLDLTDIGDFLPLSTIEFETLPLLPPTVGPGPSGLLELSLGDMLVNVYGDPGGNYGLMMQLAVTLYAEADLAIDADGLIEFNLEDPVIIMDYVTSDWPDLDGEVVEALMEAVIELIVPQVTGALDELGGIELPEIGGFGLDSPSMYREVEPAYYITAEGGLILSL